MLLCLPDLWCLPRDGAYHVVDGRRYFICLNCADHMRREDIARGIRQAVRAENVRLGRAAR